MPTRYEQLRQAVAILAAPAAEQSEFLDKLMEPLTGGGYAAAYGNDELALGLVDGIFCAASSMVACGELTKAEVVMIVPLNDLLVELFGEGNAEFWRREALSQDSRWLEVRQLANNALKQLPDERRAVGLSKNW